MTTDRELMQMALDVLKKLNKDGWILADFEDEVYASIEALRVRLAQPEREWQGLTDEEIKSAWSQLWYDLGNGKFAASDDPARHTTIMFAKEIEAKLKEKNT